MKFPSMCVRAAAAPSRRDTWPATRPTRGRRVASMWPARDASRRRGPALYSPPRCPLPPRTSAKTHIHWNLVQRS